MIKLTNNNLDSMKKGLATVDFYADWCGPCMKMKPLYEAAEKEINMLGVNCFEVNVDECGDFADENKINLIPCVILFADGVEKKRFTGGRDTKQIIEFVQNNI